MKAMNEQRKRGTIPVLLCEDVENLGRKGEVVAVKPGYARNFLLPRQLGYVADANALRMQESLREARAAQALIDREKSAGLASQISGLTLLHHVKVDHEGHLYGSVSPADIVKVLDREGVKIEKKFVLLAQPIKKIGLHDIDLRLAEGVPCSFKLKVLPEGMDELPEERVVVEAEAEAEVETEEEETP